MNFRMNRRSALVAFGLAMAVSPMALAQSSGPGKPYSQAAFDAAQAAGKAVVIEVSAPWCPVCKAQKPVLSNLKARNDLAKVEILEVDFDTQKDILKRFNVSKQSTLIAFKGKTETARSVGDSTPAGIEKLFQSAI